MVLTGIELSILIEYYERSIDRLNQKRDVLESVDVSLQLDDDLYEVQKARYDAEIARAEKRIETLKNARSLD